MECVLNDDKKCYGCWACVNKCPVNAISMRADANGFSIPKIDEAKCIECGACQEVCPSLHPVYSNRTNPSAYAFAAEEKVLLDSSSGGAFTILAEEILKSGGYVAGALFDDEFNVCHAVISDISELGKLKRSKYVQSEIKYIYKETRDLLDSRETVLFSGCPCQIAGLYGYLGEKRDKLYTIDLLCHGVPSPQMFKDYIETEYGISNIKELDFRARDGWGVRFDVTFKDGTQSLHSSKADTYTRAFNDCIDLRETCYNCSFSTVPRQGDITIGDLWSAKSLGIDISYKKGISVVLINSDNGKNLYENALKKTSYEVKVQELKGINLGKINAKIVKGSPDEGDKKKAFYDSYGRMNFSNAVNAAYHNDIGMMPFMGQNYGSIITDFALYKAVESYGYSIIVLDNLNPIQKGETNEFAQKHMNLASRFFEKDDYRTINSICDTFLVGSDQDWNWQFIGDFRFVEYSMMGFTDENKRRVAYAPSFGSERYDIDNDLRELCSYYINRFHSLSVREDYAIRMCKKLFGANAIQVIDPVFLPDVSVYYDIIKESKKSFNEGYILGYILTPSKEKRKFLVDMAKRLNKKLVVILDLKPANYAKNKASMGLDANVVRASVADWLAYFANADYIITDSYHGACFSIMFEKRFVAIKNRAIHRFDSLSRLTGICFYDTVSQLEEKNDLFDDMDYLSIKERIDISRKKSEEWLKRALQDDLTEKYSDSYNISMRYAKLLRERDRLKIQLDEYAFEEYKKKLFSKKNYLSAVKSYNGLQDNQLFESLQYDTLTEYFTSIKDGYTIIMSCKNTCAKYFNEFKKKSTLPLMKIPMYQQSYIAVIKNWENIFELSNNGIIMKNMVIRVDCIDAKIYHDGYDIDYTTNKIDIKSYIKILSMGYGDGVCRSEIFVNNVDYSLNRMGLNIVVLDNKSALVVDSFCVDTHTDKELKMIRK